MYFLARVHFVARRISQSTYRKQPRSRYSRCLSVLRCLLSRRQDSSPIGNSQGSDCCHLFCRIVVMHIMLQLYVTNRYDSNCCLDSNFPV